MPRTQLLAFLFISSVSAAILPPTLQEFTREGEPRVWAPADHAQIWQEYGLVEAEQATYKGSGKPFTITAWRLNDATGALAAWQWQRPGDATPIKNAPLSSRFPQGVIAASGNYLLRFDGYRPTASELEGFFADMPGRRKSGLPILPTYTPSTITRNSERYIIGNKTLTEFLPGWSAEKAALTPGVEIQVAELGKFTFAIFRYPTQHIARQKLEEFSAQDQLTVHRSGPLVAVIFAPDGSQPPPKVAESAFESVQFRAIVIENEANPAAFVKSAADMLMNIFVLAGVLLLICLGAGIVVGVIRYLANTKKSELSSAMQTLNLHDR